MKSKLKKLNVTKERFEKSRYFTDKYGKLEYVSESGRLFKTDKGNILMLNEALKKKPKVVKESIDVAKDPGYKCPVCGSHDCEFDDADNSPDEGYFDGAHLNARFYCNECGSSYDVTYTLKVTDVTPREDEESQDEDEFI